MKSGSGVSSTDSWAAAADVVMSAVMQLYEAYAYDMQASKQASIFICH